MHANETKILNTLSTLQSDFLSAAGNNSFESFDKSWATFNAELNACIYTLSKDTCLKVETFAETIYVIASGLLELKTAGDDLDRELEHEINTTVKESLRDLSIQDEQDSKSDSTSSPYIPSAYKWLLRNLHNPYPSKETRSAIASSTSSPLKDIDAWFIDARKRIGWNQLRKDHFKKRSDLVKAASQFFKPIPSVLSPPTPLIRRNAFVPDHSSAFVRIEYLAQQLYSDKLFPTSLASGLDNSIQPNANLTSMELTESKHGPSADYRTSYPSPAHSPARLSSSCLFPSQTYNRKRSRSSTEPPSDDDYPTSRTMKQRRYSPKASIEAAVASLPSPAASIDETNTDEDVPAFVLSTTVSIPVQSRPKRKPSFSDDDIRLQKRSNNGHTSDEHLTYESTASTTPSITPVLDEPPSKKRKRTASDANVRPQKRHNDQFAIQHCQTLSDPISLPAYTPDQTTPLDPWFEDILSSNEVTFDIPGPVTEENIDEFSEFEVNYYNYDFSSHMDSAGGLYHSASASPADSPELQDDVILPQLQAPAVCGVWEGDISMYSTNSAHETHSWAFNIPSASSTADSSWESALLTDLLSSNWTSDSLSTDDIPIQPAWPVSDISNSTINPVMTTSSPPALAHLVKSAPVAQDAKSLKLHQYHMLLAEAQALKAELAL